MLPYNQKLKARSRKLRENSTDAERKLWSKVRAKQIKGWQFYRQKIIGSYIVDFYCPKAKLVIEVDGSQHYDGIVARADKLRDEFLMAQGLIVLRFSDTEVLTNTQAVIDCIAHKLGIEE